MSVMLLCINLESIMLCYSCQIVLHVHTNCGVLLLASDVTQTVSQYSNILYIICK